MRSGSLVKTCGECKDSINVNLFHKNKYSSDGLHTYCKDCRIKNIMVYYSTDKGKLSRKMFRLRNKEKLGEYDKNYRERNIAYKKDYNKKYREKKKMEKLATSC